MRTIPMPKILVLAGALALAGCVSSGPPIRPVPQVDLSRYMGRWYVVASIPTRFERGGHNPVETYRLDKDGSVCTWFRLRPASFGAPVKLIHSTATVVPHTGNAEWKVHFFHIFSAQYLVGWLKPDYSQVLVVRDARDYLWYMARTAQVPAVDYRAMLARAKALGYDVSRIEKAPQRWPEQGAGSDTFAGECP
jgi:apolipoprotein D and lipocalin family protein